MRSWTRIPPPFLTPRRFPAESDDPALKPPARLVAVRMPIGNVGFCIDGKTVFNVAMIAVACRIIILRKSILR